MSHGLFPAGLENMKKMEYLCEFHVVNDILRTYKEYIRTHTNTYIWVGGWVLVHIQSQKLTIHLQFLIDVEDRKKVEE